MKIVKVTLAVFFLIPLLVFGQFDIIENHNTIVGPSYEIKHSKFTLVSIPPKEKRFQVGEEILIFSALGKGVTLKKYNANSLELVAQNFYEDFPDRTSIISAESFGGKYLVFYSVLNKEEDSHHICTREIDFSSTSFHPIGDTLLSLGGELKSYAFGSRTIRFSYDWWRNFTVSQSKSGNYLMITYKLYDKKKGGSPKDLKTTFRVFDESLNEVWQNDLILKPYKINFQVDDKGNVYFLEKLNYSKSKKGKAEKGVIEVIRIDRETKEKVRMKVNLPELNSVRTFELQEYFEGYMIGTGFYSESESDNVSIGYFSCLISPNNEVLDLKMKEFDQQIITQFNNPDDQKIQLEKIKEGEKYGFKYLRCLDLCVFENGSYIMVAEQHSMSWPENGGPRTYLGFLLIVKFDSDGEIIFEKKIPRDVISSYNYKNRDPFSVCTSVYKEKFLVLSFLDHQENANIGYDNPPKQFTSVKKGRMTVYKLDVHSGRISKHLLFNQKEEENIRFKKLAPYSRMFISKDGTLYLDVVNGKKDSKLVKIPGVI